MLEANKDKALKLNKAIDAGHAGDVDLITSPAYPWNTGRSGYSLEDHSATIRIPVQSSDSSNSSASLLQTPYVSFVSGGQPGQSPSQQENSTAYYQTLSEQQIPLQTRAAAEEMVSQIPNSGYQSAPLENPLMNSNEAGLFDQAGWWSSAPAINIWEHPFSMVDMPMRDPMP